MLSGEFAQLRQPRHRAVVVHDFAQHADGPQAGELRQVHRRLGVAGALQHAAGPCPQRKHMAGLDQIVGHHGRRGHDLDRPGAVGGADARGNAAGGIHAHLKIRAKALAVLLHHAVNAELLQPLDGRRHANQAAPVLRHEIYRGGRDELRGENQITFVLAVGVIHHNDQFAAADAANDGFYAVEGIFHSSGNSVIPPGPNVSRKTQPPFAGLKTQISLFLFVAGQARLNIGAAICFGDQPRQGLAGARRLF